MENIQIIETVEFRAANGVDQSTLTAAMAALETYTTQSGGLLDRHVSCSEDGLWFEHVRWENIDAANRAKDGFMASQEGQALMALIDPETVVMRHAPLVLHAAA